MDQQTMNEMPDQEPQGSPLDSMIGRVQQYIANPTSVTRETLQEMLSELQDLKTVVDVEDEPVDQEIGTESTGGLSGTIDRYMGGR